MNYNGTYISIAALIVAGLNYFGVVVAQDTAVQILAGLVALYGVINQAVAHKQLGVAAGIVRD